MSTRALTIAVLALASLAPRAPAQLGDQILVSLSPASLIVNSATAGSAPATVSDMTTTYTVTTATAGRKVTAALDSPLPSGATIDVQLEAPIGATSLGTVMLSTSPQTVVRDLPAGTSGGLRVVFRLSATSAAGVISSRSVSVTFSVTP